MKKFILLIAVALLPFVASAQSDTTRTKPKEQYCMIIATAKLFSSKVTIEVDFGQQNKLFSDQRLKDEAGKAMSFNSVIDALNYMASQGWYFVNAYALSEGNSGKVLNYIMRRPLL